MPIKVEEGKPVLNDDGLLVMVDQDGKEIDPINPVDYALEREKAAHQASGESAKRRHELKELNEQLSATQAKLTEMESLFEGIEAAEDRVEYLKNAQSALKAVEDLKDKERDLTVRIEKARREAKEEVTKQLSKEVAKRDELIAAKDSIIHQKTVSAAFGSSPFLRDEVATPIDLIEQRFSRYFKVNERGELICLDDKGEELITQDSSKGLGDPADFEEAIKRHILAHPQKDQILKGPDGGDNDQRDKKGRRTTEDFETLYPTMKGMGRKTA